MNYNEKLEWRDILGYEGLYQISNKGEVKTLRKRYNKITLLKQQNTSGYKYVVFRKEGKSENKRIHRLVAIAFIPNPENKPQVNHINSIRDDNSVENLEWCTAQENIDHCYKQGLGYTQSEYRKARQREVVGKAILQFSLSGKLIAEFQTLTEAVRHTKIQRTLIHDVLNHSDKKAGGYRWVYRDDPKTKRERIPAIPVHYEYKEGHEYPSYYTECGLGGNSNPNAGWNAGTNNLSKVTCQKCIKRLKKSGKI